MPTEERGLRSLAALVYEHTSVTVDEQRWSMLRGRVKKRVRALGLEDTNAYVNLLRTLDNAAEEIAEFIDVVTTHKTSFFRTQSVWDDLCKETSDAATWPRLSAWSCACSYGQEAYSIAMLGASLRAARPGLGVNVVASDVSPKIVKQASEGIFDEGDVQAAAKAMPDLNVESHFKATEKAGAGRVEAIPALRNLIRFRPHNLMKRSSGTFDVAFLRNVLIYFTPEDKETVVQNVISSIRPMGLLIIGESESLLERSDELEYLSPCIYRKIK